MFTNIFIVSTEYIHLSETKKWQNEVWRCELSSLIVILECLVIVVLHTHTHTHTHTHRCKITLTLAVLKWTVISLAYNIHTSICINKYLKTLFSFGHYIYPKISKQPLNKDCACIPETARHICTPPNIRRNIHNTSSTDKPVTAHQIVPE